METKRKLLFVEWLDAASESEPGWKALESIDPNPVVCWSVGWLLHENTDAITIASSVNAEHFDGDVTIPKSWIRRQVELKMPRSKKAPKAEESE